MSLFWKAYMLFFIVVFPMIMYYPMTGFETDSSSRNLTDPYWAIAYLLLALVLWVAVIVWYYNRSIRSIFRYREQAERLMRTGKRIDGEIVSSTLVREMEGAEVLDLRIKLNNLSGTPVEVTLNDIVHPDEKTPFRIGSRMRLRVDPELGEPWILPDGTEFEYNKREIMLQYLAFAAIIVFFFAYLGFSYAIQSRDYGWRFLTFYHPLITIPFSAFFYSSLILGVTKMFRPGATGSEEARFLLYGKKAEATMLNVSQTGTYINEQPQVKFVMSYADDTGRNHKVSFRQIVNLLEMHTLSQKQREILYLPEDPLKVKFV